MNVRKTLFYMLGVIIALAVVLGALVAVEQTAQDPNITNYGEAVWWSLVTMSTVGYGDFYPVTPVGRILGGVVILSSLGILGFLVGSVGQIFSTYHQRRRLGYYGLKTRGHVVIFGWNGSSREIVEQIVGATTRRVVVVTDQKDDIEQIDDHFDDTRVFGLFAEYGDIEKLRRICLDKCFRVVMNLASDTSALVHLLNLQSAFTQLPVIVALRNPKLKKSFEAAGALQVICTQTLAAKFTASVIFEPDVARFMIDLIAEGSHGPDYDIEQWHIESACSLAGKPYGEVLKELYSTCRVVPVGLSKRGEHGHKLLHLPADDVLVEAGDYLVLFSHEAKEADLEAVFRVKEGAIDV